MESFLMEPFLNSSLQIQIQPKQNFHFRFESELKNTHGFITGRGEAVTNGRNCSVRDIYPKIQMRLPDSANLNDNGKVRQFFVLCSLHSYNEEKIAEKKPLHLSPHLLLPKSKRKIDYAFVFEKMKDCQDDVTGRYWELVDHVIVRSRKKNNKYGETLRAKQLKYESLGLPLPFDKLQSDLDLNEITQSAGLIVCLGFTIFERIDDETYCLYKETIYSDPIYHGDDLKIHDICNFGGSTSGGQVVFMRIKLQSGYCYTVRVFLDVAGKTVWESYVKPMDTFLNSSIKFELPPYTGPDFPEDSIEVSMEVVVDRSTFKSRPVKFAYSKSDNSDSNGTAKLAAARKRPRRCSTIVPTPSKSSDSLSHLEQPNANASNNGAATNENPIRQSKMEVDGPATDQNVSTTTFSQSSENSTVSITNLELEQWWQNLMGPDLSLEDPPSEQGKNEYISQDRTVTPKPIKEDNNAQHQKQERKRREINDIKKRIEKCLKDPAQDITIPPSILSNKFGNTIFHDAVLNASTLLALRNGVKKSTHKDLVLKTRNKLRHNLLHYACLHDKSEAIRPLVGMGIALHEQDQSGNTPLHLAIVNRRSDCILQIQQLLQEHAAYDNKVDSSMVKMTKVYNRQGYTVLHLALLENLPELLGILLEFCKQKQIDVTEYEVLGSGDSLGHLAVKTKASTEMLKVLEEYVPNYLLIENYAGDTAAAVDEIEEISDEMEMKLNFE
ncbi:nuclear factor NF-kappa-B p110 subunit-like isoform X2 [Musca domestica]|uniref:Nuclear factor NF-kappa-B p110 subunit-like isoform X2 n=1 Tax=Musca domestica TaxID=7370 RepID=A0ABM3V7B7_MUSDO|nr:nuclear factor NF-kappa-B p110 subunit-like isoform X2 [Musca domestica]